MKLPLDAAVKATGATLLDGERAPDLLNISTDTRSLEPGDAFLALRGADFDGHDFAGEAVRKGAGMLIVADAAARVATTPTMVVQDTLRAYLALGGLARRMFDGTVVAITGSAGKTTTKALLTQLCRLKRRVIESHANENNEIGVAKVLLRLENGHHDIAIVEMGARHYGDIAVLVEAAMPQIGIITNIGDAHVEIMGSRERLAETKWALLSHGARAVLNANDEILRERAVSLANNAETIWFAAVAHAKDLARYEGLQSLIAVIGDDRLLANGSEHEIQTTLPGLYNRFNLAAAIAGATAAGVWLEELIPVIPSLRLPVGRYERLTLRDGPSLIYDAYNANANSMIAALDAFAAEPGTRRIAVLGSMAELGEESEQLHELVGAHAAGTVDVLLVSGDFAEALARGAARAGLDASRIVRVDGNAAAAAWLRANAGAADVVLLKGSRRYKLEEIVEELRA